MGDCENGDVLGENTEDQHEAGQEPDVQALGIGRDGGTPPGTVEHGDDGEEGGDGEAILAGTSWEGMNKERMQMMRSMRLGMKILRA